MCWVCIVGCKVNVFFMCLFINLYFVLFINLKEDICVVFDGDFWESVDCVCFLKLRVLDDMMSGVLI